MKLKEILKGKPTIMAKLIETNIKETNIKETNLKETNLKETNLKETNLKETNLKETNLKPLLNLNLRAFVYPGLLFLLFYPPFLRGLYFPPDLLMTHMFTAVLFALCWYDKILRRDVTFLKGYMDYAALAFVIVYVLSLFGAVNMRGAVGELLKVINYFMVYWITAQTVKTEKDIKAIFRAIYLSAVGVAIVGLGVVMGVIEYPGAVVGNRIYSTMQYPNTTATFLSLATLLGLVLLNQSQTRPGKILYTVGNMLLMTVIVASQSRGSWVLYPLVMIIFFIGLPRQHRFVTLYNMVIVLGVSLQASRVLLPRMMAGVGLTAVKYIVFGAVVVSVVQWAYDLVIDWLDRWEVRESTRRLIGTGVVVYAVVVALFYVVYTAQAVPSVAAKFVPTDSLQRARTINMQNYGLIERVDFAKTALKMAFDYPFNGLGGEGWNSLYHRYMPYLTWSSETHNYPAKVLVETGFTGLMVLIGIWFAWGVYLYRLWRTKFEEDSWTLVWVGGVAAVTLGVHSTYDFDLSMGAMGIVLWCLWGITSGARNVYNISQTAVSASARRMMGAGLAATLGTAVLFVPAVCFYAAGTAGAEGAKAMTNRNWTVAEEKLRQATQLDPFTASYAADLAQVYTIKGMIGRDRSQIALAEDYARQAVKREPYNYPVRMRLMLVSVLSGRVEQAVADAESLVANNPLDVHNFEILGKIYITSGRYLYEIGQKDKAREYWRKTGGLKKQLIEKARNLRNNPSGLEGDPLQVTPTVNLFEGEGAYLLGDYGKAASFLKEASRKEQPLPEPLYIEAQLYINAVKAKIGQNVEARREISQLSKTFPGLPVEYQKLLQVTP